MTDRKKGKASETDNQASPGFTFDMGQDRMLRRSPADTDITETPALQDAALPGDSAPSLDDADASASPVAKDKPHYHGHRERLRERFVQNQDGLPDYEVLDPVLQAYVEQNRTIAEIMAMEIDGADPEMIQRVCRLVDIAEFKRRQTPLGTRVTEKAFGRDRRIPIINRYRG